MSEKMGGFDYTEISFGADAQQSDPGAIEKSLRRLAEANLADLFVFAHGWNNDRAMARKLYARFFEQISAVLAVSGLSDRVAKTGVVGVIWPSRRWSDEEKPGNHDGGAAGLAEPLSDAQLVHELKDMFTTIEQQEALDRLADLLEERPDDIKSLVEFRRLMATLVTSPDAEEAPEDEGEANGLFLEEPSVVFQRFAPFEQSEDRGGAAGLDDVFGALWNGAKEALRQATYFEMKRRAGIVGKAGLAPVFCRLHELAPDLRIHLIGHSFGARLVSFSLAGIPGDVLSVGSSPVKSMTLIQGAFSHFAFAKKLPYDEERGGALAGMEARVDGPVIITHSASDTALSELYPLASFLGRQDAAALDLRDKWGAMGYDGAQQSGAVGARLDAVGAQYTFQKARIHNLDSDDVINNGGPPNGAHSDIIHPEVAWAILCAARLTA